MGVTVSMHLVMFGLVASLALLSAAIYAGMRGQTALVWLAAALSCGGTETLILGIGATSDGAVAAVSILVPAAYLCVAQSIRLSLGLRVSDRLLVVAVVALAALSLLLLALRVPYLYGTLPFQAAGALALGDSLLSLYRKRSGSLVDTCLLVAMCGMAAAFVARMPLFPVLIDGATPYGTIERSTLQSVLLTSMALLAPLAVLLIIAKVIGGVIATYRDRSERDGLTNLLNRTSFERTAAETGDLGGAVIVCDIDHFKQVNDRYGHAVGDDVIRVFASLLERSTGWGGRLGGEEFALLMPGASTADAAARANAIRKTFHSLRHPALGRDHRLSASFGIARLAAGEPPHAALVRADGALYQAKHEGRNRIAVHSNDAAVAFERVRPGNTATDNGAALPCSQPRV